MRSRLLPFLFSLTKKRGNRKKRIHDDSFVCLTKVIARHELGRLLLLYVVSSTHEYSRRRSELTSNVVSSRSNSIKRTSKSSRYTPQITTAFADQFGPIDRYQPTDQFKATCIMMEVDCLLVLSFLMSLVRIRSGHKT
jgi:hypothetical protein